ncbi:glycosyltransferase family 9 protein [bacterium]|nr:glycosyltransferase family 9 protein [bacterium]
MSAGLKLSAPPQRVLLCRTDRLGDVVLALPCAALLRRLFPACHISFLVQEYTAPIVELYPVVDRVIAIQLEAGWRGILQKIEGGNFDAAILLYPDRQVTKAVKASGVPMRTGIAYRWHSWQYTYRHREHRKHNLKHEAEYNLSLTYAAFFSSGDWSDSLRKEELYPLKLEIPVQVKSEVDARVADINAEGSRVFALHPGGGGSAHRWPLEYFCRAAQELVKDSNVKLIVTGSAVEKNLCSAVASAGGSQAHNLCGRLSLQGLAELYRRCDLLLTNSTGPLHLAVMMGTKVLGLFPRDHAMSPLRWGPYGLQDQVLMPPEGGTMQDLTVETVTGRIKDLCERP